MATLKYACTPVHHTPITVLIALNAGVMTLCHNHIATFAMAVNTPLIAGQAVPVNHDATAEIAVLMPSHAAWTMFRKVSLLRYAMTTAATRAPIASTVNMIGLAFNTALNAIQIPFHTFVSRDASRIHFRNPPAAAIFCWSTNACHTNTRAPVATARSRTSGRFLPSHWAKAPNAAPMPLNASPSATATGFRGASVDPKSCKIPTPSVRIHRIASVIFVKIFDAIGSIWIITLFFNMFQAPDIVTMPPPVSRMPSFCLSIAAVIRSTFSLPDLSAWMNWPADFVPNSFPAIVVASDVLPDLISDWISVSASLSPCFASPPPLASPIIALFRPIVTCSPRSPDLYRLPISDAVWSMVRPNC